MQPVFSGDRPHGARLEKTVHHAGVIHPIILFATKVVIEVDFYLAMFSVYDEAHVKSY